METERVKALVPFLFVDGVLAFTVLMLLYLDWIVNHTLYRYGLGFSFDWAVPYWMAFRMTLLLIGLTIVAVTVIGYGSYKKAKKEIEKIVFLCKSCGNAWSEIDRSVNVKSKLPKFKILKGCPSCDKKLLDEETMNIQTETVKAHVETPIVTETSESHEI